jgi:hypothetical protein
MWLSRFRRVRSPRFPYKGAGILLVLAATGLLVFLRIALAPTPRATPPFQPIEPPARPLPTPPSPPSSEEPPEIPAPQEGCPEGCTSSPPGCDIKGNISLKTGEHIYHLPGQGYYDKTVISPDKGERWFCTEEEAEANGWRRAKV